MRRARSVGCLRVSGVRVQTEKRVFAYMIALSRQTRRWRRVLLLRFFFLRNDSVKDVLAVGLSLGPFRGIYLATRPLLSYTRTHSSPEPLEWICSKRSTTDTSTVSLRSEFPLRVGTHCLRGPDNSKCDIEELRWKETTRPSAPVGR